MTCHLTNAEAVSLVSWWQATRASMFSEFLAAATLMGSEVLGLAPLFDHNLVLFPEDMSPDFPGWEGGG